MEENGQAVFDLRDCQVDYLQMAAGQTSQAFDLDLRLTGDVWFVFFDHDEAYETSVGPCGLGQRRRPAADTLCFFVWLHTGFVRSDCVTLDLVFDPVLFNGDSAPSLECSP